MIRFQAWLPVNVCSTSSGDLYIIMMSSYDLKQTKVVRYSDFREKQSIQFNKFLMFVIFKIFKNKNGKCPNQIAFHLHQLTWMFFLYF